MKWCKKNFLLSNGICISNRQECVKENCNQWQPFTQYDRIKTMSINYFADFIEKDMLELDGGCIKAHHKCEYVITCGSCVNAPECIKQWLESEVETE